MSTTWILLIAIFVVLHLVMHRGHGGHGGHRGGRQSSGRGHAGHGCGPGRREQQSEIDDPAPDGSPGTAAHRHG